MKLTGFVLFQDLWFLECLISCYFVTHGPHVLQLVSSFPNLPLQIPSWDGTIPSHPLHSKPSSAEFASWCYHPNFQLRIPYLGLNLVVLASLLTHIDHTVLTSSYSFWSILWHSLGSSISRALVFRKRNFFATLWTMVLPICKFLIEMAPVLLFRLEFSYHCQAPDTHRSHATQLFLQLLVDFVKLTGFDSFEFSGLLECLISCYLCAPWFICAPASTVVFSQNLSIANLCLRW